MASGILAQGGGRDSIGTLRVAIGGMFPPTSSHTSSFLTMQCCKNFDRTPIENMYKREFLLGRFWKTELDRNKDIAAVNKPK